MLFHVKQWEGEMSMWTDIYRPFINMGRGIFIETPKSDFATQSFFLKGTVVESIFRSMYYMSKN